MKLYEIIKVSSEIPLYNIVHVKPYISMASQCFEIKILKSQICYKKDNF